MEVFQFIFSLQLKAILEQPRGTALQKYPIFFIISLKYIKAKYVLQLRQHFVLTYRPLNSRSLVLKCTTNKMFLFELFWESNYLVTYKLYPQLLWLMSTKHQCLHSLLCNSSFSCSAFFSSNVLFYSFVC